MEDHEKPKEIETCKKSVCMVVYYYYFLDLCSSNWPVRVPAFLNSTKKKHLPIIFTKGRPISIRPSDQRFIGYVFKGKVTIQKQFYSSRRRRLVSHKRSRLDFSRGSFLFSFFFHLTVSASERRMFK